MAEKKTAPICFYCGQSVVERPPLVVTDRDASPAHMVEGLETLSPSDLGVAHDRDEWRYAHWSCHRLRAAN